MMRLRYVPVTTSRAWFSLEKISQDGRCSREQNVRRSDDDFGIDQLLIKSRILALLV